MWMPGIKQFPCSLAGQWRQVQTTIGSVSKSDKFAFAFLWKAGSSSVIIYECLPQVA